MKVSSDVLMMILGTDPFNTLEEFAQVYSNLNQIKPRLPELVGWVSWDYYKFGISEEEGLDMVSLNPNRIVETNRSKLYPNNVSREVREV